MKTVVIKAGKNNFNDAIEKAKSLFAKSGDVEVTLNFASGRFNFDKEVNFDVADYQGKKKLRILGAGKTSTILSSITNLSKEDFINDGELSYVQLPKNEKGEYLRIGAFYRGDKQVKLSTSKRYRISPYFMNDKGEIVSANTADKSTWENRHKFYLDLDSVKELQLDEQNVTELHVFVEWEFKICHTEKVDLNDTYVDEKGKTFVAVYVNPNERIVGNKSLCFTSRPMYVCNNISILKQYGGYTYVQEEGKLYVRTKDLNFSKPYSVGNASRLFVLNGFESVEISDLTITKFNDYIKENFNYWCSSQAGCSVMISEAVHKLEGSRGFPPYSVVYATNLNGLTVKDCIFKELPCGAVSGDHTLKNVKIIDNDFINIGASAVRLGTAITPDTEVDGDEKHYLENVDIINNYINVTGAFYNENCALTITRVNGLRIQYNTILNSGYSGISVGWLWQCPKFKYGENINVLNADISHNFIKTYMIYTSDGGAIYMLGGNIHHENDSIVNYVHENYIVETTKTALQRRFFSGLYHDGSCSSWYNGNNVVVHHPKKHNIYSSRLFLQYWAPDGNSFNVANENGQCAWNIHIKNNHYVGCRDKFDVYHRYLAHVMEDHSRNLHEHERHFYKNIDEAMKNAVVEGVVKSAGCKR